MAEEIFERENLYPFFPPFSSFLPFFPPPSLPPFLPSIALSIHPSYFPATHPSIGLPIYAFIYVYTNSHFICPPKHASVYSYFNLFFLTGSHYVAGLKLTTYSRLDRDLPLRPKCWDLCFAILQSFFPHTYIYSSLCLPTLFLHTHPFMHASNHSVYINSSLTYLCVPESSHSTIPFTGPF